VFRGADGAVQHGELRLGDAWVMIGTERSGRRAALRVNAGSARPARLLRALTAHVAVNAGRPGHLPTLPAFTCTIGPAPSMRAVDVRRARRRT
jgi:hypothetical protein